MSSKAKGGITKGKSHAEGGMPMVVKSTGQKVELEGGEGVINKKNMADTQKHEFEGKMLTKCEIASEINSDGGNGVEIDCDGIVGKKYKHQDGGRLAEGGEIRLGKYYHPDGVLAHTIIEVETLKDGKIVNFIDHNQNNAELGVMLDTYKKYFLDQFGYIHESEQKQYEEGGDVKMNEVTATRVLDYEFGGLLNMKDRYFNWDVWLVRNEVYTKDILGDGIYKRATYPESKFYVYSKNGAKNLINTFKSKNIEPQIVIDESFMKRIEYKFESKDGNGYTIVIIEPTPLRKFVDSEDLGTLTNDYFTFERKKYEEGGYFKDGEEFKGWNEKAKEVWNSWNPQQRKHFMYDHRILRGNQSDFNRVSYYDFDKVYSPEVTDQFKFESDIQDSIIEHIRSPRYAKGGEVDSILKRKIERLEEKISGNENEYSDYYQRYGTSERQDMLDEIKRLKSRLGSTYAEGGNVSLKDSLNDSWVMIGDKVAFYDNDVDSRYYLEVRLHNGRNYEQTINDDGYSESPQYRIYELERIIEENFDQDPFYYTILNDYLYRNVYGYDGANIDDFDVKKSRKWLDYYYENKGGDTLRRGWRSKRKKKGYVNY